MVSAADDGVDGKDEDLAQPADPSTSSFAPGMSRRQGTEGCDGLPRFANTGRSRDWQGRVSEGY
jgi:hypothetical protein